MYFSLLLDAKKEQLKEMKHEKETIQTTTKSTITLKLTSSSKWKSTETKTKTATTTKTKTNSTSIKTITPKSTKVANYQLVFSLSFFIKCFTISCKQIFSNC